MHPILVEFEERDGNPVDVLGIRFSGDTLVQFPLREAPWFVSLDDGISLLRKHLKQEVRK